MKPFSWIPLLVLSVAGISCGRQQAESLPKQTHSDVAGIARIGEAVISEASFKELLARRARSMPEGAGAQKYKESVLEELVRTETVYAKALAAGFDQQPEVAVEVKKLIVGKFQEQQLTRRAATTSISEAELRECYHRNTARFTMPAAVSGAVIFLKVGVKAGEEQIAQRRAAAEAIWSEASAASAEIFQSLASSHSEDQATRYLGGATGWLIREENSGAWETAVVDALFSLPEPGAVAPLVATPRGFYIVKLVDRRPASVKPLEQVRETLSYQLKRAKEQQNEQEFYEGMKAGLDIQINRPLLESIVLPTQPDGPPRTPGTQTAQIRKGGTR
jgi:parvulin-like peptidyl-prolyl isomerase